MDWPYTAHIRHSLRNRNSEPAQFDTVFLQNNPAAFINAGGIGGQDALDFRRARLRADGTMYGTIDWATEYDFVNSSNLEQVTPPGSTPTGNETNVAHVPAPTDLWVNFREVPLVGNIKIGNHKEPIGFEHLTSSRYLDFMERSFNQDIFYGAFNNGFTPGISIYDNWSDDDRGTWTTGVFKNVNNVFAFGVGDGEYAWTSRVTYLPWYEDEGKYLMHLGVAARYSTANLSDSGLDGGQVDDVTLGLNWFLNPNMKVQTNYVYTTRDTQAGVGGGHYSGVGMRLAWDF